MNTSCPRPRANLRFLKPRSGWWRPVISTLLLGLAVGVGRADLTDGLVAYYPFNGNATDASGHGHDGTAVGSVSYGAGPAGQALLLDGSSYVRVANHADFRLWQSDEKTFVFWVQGTGGWVKYAFISTLHGGSGWDAGTLLWENLDSLFDVGVFASENIHNLQNLGSSFRDWSCVAFVKSASGWTVYQNGQLISFYDSYEWPYGADVDSNGDLLIGGNVEPMNNACDCPRPLIGSLDELRIYNRALSASEIQQLAQGPFEVAVGSATGCPGSTVVVPVKAVGTATLGTLQFSLHWDPAMGSLVDVEQFGLPGMSAEANFGTGVAEGTLTVSWDDPSLTGTAVTDGTTLFAMRFTLSATPPSPSSITIDGTPVAAELTSPDFEVVTTTLTAGTVSTPSPVDIAGTVRYYASGTAVPDVAMDLTGDATQTTPSLADGTYLHTVAACGSYTVTPAKSTEATPSTGVTMLDASLVRLHVLGVTALDSPFKLLAADVNGSHTITTVDIRLLKQLVLDLRSTLPAGLWRFVSTDYSFPSPTAPWNPEAVRSYTGLEASMSGQDFTAVKLGDVNASWGGGGGAGLMNTGGRGGVGLMDTESAPGLQIGSVKAPLKGTIEIPITARNLRRLTSAQFTLQWDPKVLRFIDAGQCRLPGGGPEDFGTARTGQGLLSFGWDDPTARGVNVNEDQIFLVRFKVIGRAGASTKVSITNYPTLKEIAFNFVPTQVTATQGIVSIVPEAARSLAVPFVE